MLSGIDIFEQKYGSELTNTLLEFMCECNPYRILGFSELHPFVTDGFRLFMHDDKHVLLNVSERESLDREGGNHRFTGDISVDGEVWNFSVVSGNWNGTDIEQWERDEDVTE